MDKKVAPPAEKFASCPYDGKILEYYEGYFESVYVLLHPFLRSSKINLKERAYKTWPRKHEIISKCEAVTWSEVMNLSGLNTISEIDIGLRTSIQGLTEEFSNKDYSARIESLLESNGISQDSEGDLQAFLEDKIIKAIKSLGHEWLWLGDEHGFERKLHWIDDILQGDMLPPSGCIFTHDHSILITTHWDSHCSFLCGSKQDIDKILEYQKFEGFFCTENTEVYWGLHKI